MALILGLDAGTSLVKALCVRADGTVVATAAAELDTRRPQPGLSEQDPAAIWRACQLAIREAVQGAAGEPIVALGLSAQRSGVLLAQRDGEPLGPLITWQDTRHVAQARRLASGEYGWRPPTGLGSGPLARLLWLREHEEDRLTSAAFVFCTVKDWLVLQLTGEPATDHSSVSISGLYDAGREGWSQDALSLAGLAPRQVSRVVACTAIAGRLRPEAAAQLGLEAEIPVVVGCGDGEASNIGLGALDRGIYGGSIGTVCAMRVRLTEFPNLPGDWRGLYATHLAPVGWVLTGTLNTGGAALAWLKETLTLPSFSKMDELAASLGDGPGDLVFIPHMAGLRSPRQLPEARGVLFGLGLHHGPAHLVRAVMEGVAFGMTAILDDLARLAETPRELRLGGGGARSDRWLDMIAAASGIPVVRTTVREASALGAALCAAVGVGWFETLSEATSLVRVSCRSDVAPERRASYRRRYEAYRKLLDDLTPHYSELAGLAGGDVRWDV